MGQVSSEALEALTESWMRRARNMIGRDGAAYPKGSMERRALEFGGNLYAGCAGEVLEIIRTAAQVAAEPPPSATQEGR